MATTTLVEVAGKGSNPKTTLYVGGLAEGVTEEVLQAAFLPFGDLKDVNVPLDHATGAHRGFGFVEFEDKDDAQAAVDNMHRAEIYGRTLRVNFAQPMRIKGGDKGFAHQPVWADADAYLREVEAEEEFEALEREQDERRKQQAAAAAREASGLGAQPPPEASAAAAAVDVMQELEAAGVSVQQ